ncbi:LysR substrate binding domain [Raoultella planticola]|uniref:LysR substrate binding domain n=1 Tax=Raoultella planticola TaxID=575 RepID=A0A485AC52_RAOPL|nr:LysR substrate binding domain [Raoultella planticola]
MRELQSGQIDFGIGAIDSSLPAALQIYPLREDPFVAVLHGDDPLADQPHLPWKLLAGRDIAVFSKGNIQRLVGALAESHRLTLNTRFQVTILKRCMAWCARVWRLPFCLSCIPPICQDPVLKIAQLQQPALARTVALMRGPQPLPPLIEQCFTLLLNSLTRVVRAAQGRCLISTSIVR